MLEFQAILDRKKVCKFLPYNHRDGFCGRNRSRSCGTIPAGVMYYAKKGKEEKRKRDISYNSSWTEHTELYLKMMRSGESSCGGSAPVTYIGINVNISIADTYSKIDIKAKQLIRMIIL